MCAHGERLYSFRIRETIPDTPLHDKLKIVKKKGQFVSGKSDLFAVVIALRYLIGNEDFKKFKRDLLRLINDTLKACLEESEKSGSSFSCHASERNCQWQFCRLDQKIKPEHTILLFFSFLVICDWEK